MDLNEIRQLIRNGSSVVIMQDGQPPLLVQELRSTGAEAKAAATGEPEAEVPIASRWPKGRSIHERPQQDEVLQRLNSEILALREQIAAEEAEPAPVQMNS